MHPILRSSPLTFLVLTAYFVAGSLVSDSMRFPYGYVSVGALILFLGIGFLLARHGSILNAALSTGIAGLASSLAAWAILYFVSPLRRGDPRPVADAVGEVVVVMTAAALLLGAIGASLKRLTEHA